MKPSVEQTAKQERPCIHTVATGKHEWNSISHHHQSGDRFWIPRCDTCGWVDTEQLVSDALDKLVDDADGGPARQLAPILAALIPAFEEWDADERAAMPSGEMLNALHDLKDYWHSKEGKPK